MIALAVFAAPLAHYTRASFAEEAETKTFSSVGEACQALSQAVQNDDEKALESIIGKELISSGDDAVDKVERERFKQKYQEMHRLVQEPDGTTILYVGAENWPFPIPLVSEKGGCHFDTRSGMQEIVFRRIGYDEATAIQVCHALVAAKKQHQTNATSDEPISQYAQGLISARASNADDSARATREEPFHGYYFRILTERPGKAGATGSGSSVRKKTSGLAVVAYPAEYRSSGVMTFIVTEDGRVYERDLGPDTARVAGSMKDRPASGWHPVS